MSTSEHDEYLEWLNKGVERKWVSLPTCLQHEFVPLTPDEENEMEIGYDPCIIGMRVWV